MAHDPNPCKKCGETKPLTEEYWKPDTRGRGGWQTICRTCQNTARKAAKARAKARNKSFATAEPELKIPIVRDAQSGELRPIRYNEWLNGEPAPGVEVVGYSLRWLYEQQDSHFQGKNDVSVNVDREGADG